MEIFESPESSEITFMSKNLKLKIFFYFVIFLFPFLFAELTVRVTTLFNPTVRYLASAGIGSVPKVFLDLNDFIQNYAGHLTPHRNWNNYWTNELGFNDKEFEFPKPKGRFRILAFGDSFCYGMVKYPDNVMTLTEDHLRSTFNPSVDLDLLNLGIPATGLWEYSALLNLIREKAEPDLIVVHIYLGNDPPDLVEKLPIFGGAFNPFKRSFAYRYLVNSLHLIGMDSLTLRASEFPEGIRLRGGQQVRPGKDPMAPPRSVFSEKQFLTVLKNELTRFYHPQNFNLATDRRWLQMRSQIELIKAESKTSNARLLIVLYPSQLQLYSEIRDRVFEFAEKLKDFKGIKRSDFNFSFPNEAITQIAEELLIPIIDITPDLAHVIEKEHVPLYSEKDTHWNVRGNAEAAKSEAEKIVLSMIIPKQSKN